MSDRSDPRLGAPTWDASPRESYARLRLLLLINVVLAGWYFGWLLQPVHVGHGWLFAALVAAELFNLTQAVGFWWTVSRQRVRPPAPPPRPGAVVDVFIPVYDEGVDVVAPTIAAATRLHGAHVRVALLDDGPRAEMEQLAAHYSIRYIARGQRTGAKAGNINYALARTSAPYVAIFDSDHVSHPGFLEATLGYFEDEGVAFVQTPQYYANAAGGGIAGAAWAQQALFFGAIARGKDGLGAMFCCGTNVVFRRAALDDAGGFPERSLTEDFELSITLHERGWRTVYVPKVLASGLGPEDMSSYIKQQMRWARGCLSAMPRAVGARLPWRLRLQYMLSSMFFLTGWTLLVYMSLPVIRIFTGVQPLAEASADQFLMHFAPYFGAALGTVAIAGLGSYTYSAFSLLAANFWVHIQATIAAVVRLPTRFVVTPKQSAGARQPLAVAPALIAIAGLAAAAIYGLLSDTTPATLNNVAFAAVHIAVLMSGASLALRAEAPGTDLEVSTEQAPAA